MPYQLKSHFESQLKPEQAGELLARLIDLAQTKPHTEQRVTGTPISLEFGWVGKLFSCVLQILLRKSSLTSDEAQSAAKALRMLGHMLNYGHLTSLDDETIKALDTATEQHPAVRQNYAWQRIESYRQRWNKEPIGFFQLIDHHHLLRFSANDAEWLIRDITEKPEIKDRQLALRLATELLINFRLGRRRRSSVRRAIRNDEELSKMFRALRTQKYWRWLRRVYHWRIGRNLGSRWWWHLQFRTVTEKRRHVRDQWRLLTHLGSLASGKAIGWLAHLITVRQMKLK